LKILLHPLGTDIPSPCQKILTRCCPPLLLTEEHNTLQRHRLYTMKLINFIIFFSIFLTIYISVNYYIFIRGWQAIPKESSLRTVYLALFIFVSASYIFGRFLERFTICRTSDVCIWIGSFWLGLMLYLFLAVLFLDIVRAVNHFLPFLPAVITENYQRSKSIAFIAILVIASGIVLAGHLNSLNPRIRELNIEIDKGAPQPLNIVLVTDIHLGTLISNSRLYRMVEEINRIHPDIVLLGGDIVDEDLEPVIEKNLGETLKAIQSQYGTFAITGNHEYIGGVEAAYRYLEDHNITVLRDRAVKIGDFYLAGREDRSMHGFTGKQRKPLDRILEGVDKRYPLILMDHQPFGLREAAANGVDLQLSGHTHHGQLWPLNYITSMIYELSWGYKRIGDSHFYVSCGFGTWGPPVRTGNRPEIVYIRIRFTGRPFARK
jgi:predicted MPP superfamily phosphohydrolase